MSGRTWQQGLEAAGPIACKVRKHKSINGDNQLNFFFFYSSQDPSPWSYTAHTIACSLQLLHLEIPSERCPEICLLGDSGFCQVESLLINTSH